MAKALIAWHGDSGDGKTSLLGSAALWLSKAAPGKVMRVLSADNVEPLEPFIDAGIVEVWNVLTSDHPFEAIVRGCQGYWPSDLSNPKSKLVPPSAATWEKVAALGCEGLSTFSDVEMNSLADKLGEGTRVGPGTRPGEDGISFKDGDYGVGGNTQTHYNIVQNQMYKCVRATGALPVHVFWTAHTVKAVEDNKPIFGPQLAGKKATPLCQRWFGSLLHCHTVPSKGGGVEYRLYLKEHYDKDIAPTVPFKAVTRVPLVMLDPKTRATIEVEWSKVIPEYLVWTNKATVMEEYVALRQELRKIASQIILKG